MPRFYERIPRRTSRMRVQRRMRGSLSIAFSSFPALADGILMYVPTRRALPPADVDELVERARRRSLIILICAFWFFAFLMLSIWGSFAIPWSFDELAPRRLLTAAFGSWLCLVMAHVLERLRGLSFPSRVVCGLVGALGMAVLITLFNMTMNRLVIPLPAAPRITLSETVQWIMVWFGYTLAWTGTHLALVYHWEAQDHLRRTLLMQELAQKAKVAALQYQLNPHFLFNALNSISALVLEGRNCEAEAMLLNLSTFLRCAPAEETEGMVSLKEEIQLIKLYLAIEEARFSERMHVRIEIPDALRVAAVPSLILQPLVENAVCYGVGRSETMTTITIVAEQTGQRLRLLVDDDGSSRESTRGGSGLGLRNVRERLHVHFGAAGSLIAGDREEGGYRAIVEMPITLSQ